MPRINEQIQSRAMPEEGLGRHGEEDSHAGKHNASHRSVLALPFTTVKGCVGVRGRNSSSIKTPSRGLVDTPARHSFSRLTALKRKSLTNAPTTRATSSCPRYFPGHTRGP